MASFSVLLDGYSGPVATIGRAGVAICVIFYVAFEAIARVPAGLLVQEAQALPPAQRADVTQAVDAFVAPAVALGFLGSIGAFVAVVAAGIRLRRSGAPLVPIVLLGGAPLATVFHGGLPLDAVAMAAFLVGVAWLELRWRRAAEQRATEAV